jgi:hypothetical protein
LLDVTIGRRYLLGTNRVAFLTFVRAGGPGKIFPRHVVALSACYLRSWEIGSKSSLSCHFARRAKDIFSSQNCRPVGLTLDVSLPLRRWTGGREIIAIRVSGRGCISVIASGSNAVEAAERQDVNSRTWSAAQRPESKTNAAHAASGITGVWRRKYRRYTARVWYLPPTEGCPALHPRLFNLRRSAASRSDDLRAAQKRDCAPDASSGKPDGVWVQ